MESSVQARPINEAAVDDLWKTFGIFDADGNGHSPQKKRNLAVPICSLRCDGNRLNRRSEGLGGSHPGDAIPGIHIDHLAGDA